VIIPNSELRFTWQTQAQNNWCWAAVAASTAHFYDRKTTQTQCKIANAILNVSQCCCANGDSLECDVQESVEKALIHVGHLRACKRGALSWAAIENEINASNPVGAQISLISGSAHFGRQSCFKLWKERHGFDVLGFAAVRFTGSFP